MGAMACEPLHSNDKDHRVERGKATVGGVEMEVGDHAAQMAEGGGETFGAEEHPTDADKGERFR